MSELTKRVLFAVPAAALVLVITWFGGRPFEILMGILAGFTLWEVHRIVTAANSPDYFPLSVLLGFTFWMLPLLPEILVISVSSVLLLVTIWAIIDKKSEASGRWLSTLFTGIYAPIGFFMIVQIRNLGVEIDGFWLTLALFFMIWGNDVFAYFGGKTFGKRPLAPKISPKKTVEGFLFGFLGAAVGYLIVYLLADPFPLTLWHLPAAVVLISIFGPLGDIAASKLKRLANVKDSSSLLPGHGGLFDRFDSMILSAPFIFFYFYFLI